MEKDCNIVIAGFGGQGVLFAGQVAAYCGLMDKKEVSWLPSYGPEMRGGTANCSICISERPIGSPLITNPNIFVAMNLPSFEKFIDDVESGGTVIVDSFLVNKKTDRKDINAFYIPATKIAEENNLKGLTNMILIGKMFKETGFCCNEALNKALEKSVSAKRQHLVELNKKAIQLGMDY